MSCEKIQPLLSKYADNEATQRDREVVRAHVAGCVQCAHKLAEFEQVQAVFASSATRPPEPELRVGVFREIKLIKEEERRKQHSAQEKRPWYLPVRSLRMSGRSRSGLARLLTTFNPVAAAVVAALAIFAVLAYTNRPASVPKLNANANLTKIAYMPPVPTAPAPTGVGSFTSDTGVTQVDGSPMPDPSISSPQAAISTRAVPASFSPVASTGNATVLPDAMSEGFIFLSDPTPVLEDLDSSGKPTHLIRDPLYGYSVYYPANWWTQTDGSVRYFRPWASDGSNSSPYWIEVHVVPNDPGYTAQTYNSAYLNGAGTLIRGAGKSDMRLRHIYLDAERSYDDLYSFDDQHIYTLQLVVPTGQRLADFTRRWYEAEAIFSRMSARADFTQSVSNTQTSDNRSILFLNGSDLYMVRMDGQARAITNGGFNVRQFALSPDMSKVAFTSAQTRADGWPRQLYMVDLQDGVPGTVRPLWSEATQIHDIVWYSDRVLLALAKSPGGSGLYRISLPQEGLPTGSVPSVQLITPLADNMAGAKSLMVSPDRQLITFLAPVGESAGTDVYAVRPDGSNLQVLISHSAPISPRVTGTPVLASESQAIKSYAWVEGHLKARGYKFNMLFTCGKSLSPALDRGGFLYSVPSGNHYSLLGNTLLGQLGVSDPTKLQIVHVAYSTDGKVAMTGYYNDSQEGRADKLAGLWTADVVDGQVLNMRSQPLPQAPDGITDLQWSPDNSSLIYRETVPQDPDSPSARYDRQSPFMMIKQDLHTGSRTVLYGGSLR